MSLTVFKNLTEKLCALIGLGDPRRLLDGDPIEVNGITFSLVYNDKIDPQLVFIYCDFGRAPANRKAEVYEALLEANMFVHPAGFPAFSVSPQTKHVIFASHRHLSSVTAEDLCELLAELAEQAEDWRKHFFLVPAVDAALRDYNAVPN